MNHLKLAIISKSANQWPLFIGVEEGFFAKEDLDIDIVVTRSSQKHLEDLNKGGVYDIGHQAADHIIRSVDKGSDLFMFMGISSPNQSLIVQPDIIEFKDLKGKRLGVDGTASGYALLLKTLLEKYGLSENDYTLIPIGGTDERFNAILNGEVSGAFIDGPVDLKAEMMGYRRLGSNHDVGIEYQGTVAATKKEWAITHEDILVKYIRGYISATHWFYQTENKKRAVEILKQFVDVSTELANKTFDRYKELQIFNPQAKINVNGIFQVFRMLEETGKVHQNEKRLENYYDQSFYQKALTL